MKGEALSIEAWNEPKQQIEDEIRDLVEGGKAPADLDLEPVVEEMVLRAEMDLDRPVNRDEIVDLVLAVHGDFCALE